MRKALSILAMVLGVALPLAGFDYPEEVVGVCPILASSEQVFMVPYVIDGPISVPVDSSIGYKTEVVYDHASMIVGMGLLMTDIGREVAPPDPFYLGDVTLLLDTDFCHYKREWIEDGILYYQIWLFDEGGVLHWHFGDWEIGSGGMYVEFGEWHVEYSEGTLLVQEKAPAIY